MQSNVLIPCCCILQTLVVKSEAYYVLNVTKVRSCLSFFIDDCLSINFVSKMLVINLLVDAPDEFYFLFHYICNDMFLFSPISFNTVSFLYLSTLVILLYDHRCPLFPIFPIRTSLRLTFHINILQTNVLKTIYQVFMLQLFSGK